MTDKDGSQPRDTPGWSSRISRRTFIGRSAGVALSVGGLGSFLAACGGSGGQVNVLSWISYVDPTVKKLFEEENPGITMNGVPAPADQDMFTKVKAGGGNQYDIVFANAGWTPTYHENELTEPLSMGDFPQSSQLYPVFQEDPNLPYVLKPGELLLVPEHVGVALDDVEHDRSIPATPALLLECALEPGNPGKPRHAPRSQR